MSDERRRDETDDMFERIEREFGERTSSDSDAREAGMYDPAASRAPGATPQPAPVYRIPAERRISLRLPVSRPRLVYVLLTLNVLMYILTVMLTLTPIEELVGVSGDRFTLVLYLLGAKEGEAIDAGQYWRFLTPIVLHGGLIHLAFNSYALYALGPETERVFGSLRFLAIYLLAGLAGTIASYIRSDNLSIGASGAIFGLIGALAAFFYTARGLIGAEASRQQMTQLISMAAINIVLGLTAPAVDNAAHLGGMGAGALAGFALAPRYVVDDRLYPPVLGRRDHPAQGWLLAGMLLMGMIGLIVAVLGRYA